MGSTLYRELAELPTYTSALFLNGDDEPVTLISVTSSVRDHTRKIKRSLTKNFVCTEADTYATPPQSSPDVLLSAVSPSGKLVAYLREVDSSGVKKRFVEVWAGQILTAIKEVTNLHADFYTDEFFKSLSFSPSEAALVYTAEANAPVEDEENRFRYVPTLGERLLKRARPTLFHFKWTSKYASTVSALQLSSSSVLYGQAVFLAEDSIIARGYEPTPDGRRLAISGCLNRPCTIWKLRLSNQSFDSSLEAVTIVDRTRISASGVSARSPRVIRYTGTSSVLWLENELGGPHSGCSALHKYDLETTQDKEIIPIVNSPDSFPGLFSHSILERSSMIWANCPALAVQSVSGSRNVIILVNLEDGSVKELTEKETSDDVRSYVLLATDGKRRILCVRSTPATVPELVLGTLGNQGITSWRILEQPALSREAEGKLKGIKSSIKLIDGRSPVETILIRPTSTNVPPLITLPHGGPHISSTTEFNAFMTAMAAEGYAVSMVNYTGSAGYGQSNIKALIGRAGDLDVEDCYASIRYLINNGLASDEPGKQFIIGGSHGGFIGAHLISRYPDAFAACALRNPVTAAGDMVHVTDIPDWCFAEFGIAPEVAHAHGHVLTPEGYARLQAASPIAHVGNIRTPLLLLAGDADARVPMTQSRAFYHALKAFGHTDVEMHVFPGGGHSLDTVDAELRSWELTKNWFARVAKF